MPTEDVEELVLDQYKDSSLLLGFLRSVSIPLNELLQIITVEFPKQFWLHYAVGFWLDVIGDYVGQEREGLSNDDYKKEIIFKIFLNNSSGTPDEIIAFTQHYLPSAKQIDYRETSPATVHLHIITDHQIPTEFLSRVNQIALGGVKVTGSTSNTTGPYFSFAPEPTGNSDDAGFSEEDDTSIVGGMFEEEL